MNKTQKILFGLLQDFDKICQKHGVEYIFIGGSALGAVRHGGFIPWDDDMDLLVSREDFVKLDKAMQAEELKDRAWITEDNTPSFHNPLGKFFDTTTTDFYRSQVIDGSPNCHHLEIFIADPYPNDEEARKDHNKYLWLYTELQNPYFPSANLGMPDGMLDPDLLAEYQEKVEKEGWPAVRAEILEHLTHPEDECDSICQRWSYRPVVFRKEWLADKTRMKFESGMFPVGKEVLHRLVANYGENWDLIPLKSEREIHDGVENGEIAYGLHADEALEIFDECGYADKLYQNKVDRRQRTIENNAIDNAASHVKLAYLSAKAAAFETKTWDYEPSMQSDYAEQFKEFFKVQFYARYKKFNRIVPLRDDLLESMLYTLLHEGGVSRARYLLETHPNFGKYDEFSTMCDLLGELKVQKYAKDKGAVLAILEQLKAFPKLAGQIETERAAMWAATQDEGSRDESKIELLYGECVHMADPEIKKYVGDMYLALGDRVKADTYYRPVIKKGRNGMVIRDLKEKGFLPGDALNEFSEKVLNLLDEFDEICKQLKLNYATGGIIPSLLNRNKFENFYRVTVYMVPHEVKAFLNYVKSHPRDDRALEYYGTNEEHPFLSVYYVDSTTMLIDTSSPFTRKENGAHIEIVPVRSSKREVPEKLMTKIDAQLTFRRQFVNELISAGEEARLNELRAERDKMHFLWTQRRGRKLFDQVCEAFEPEEDERVYIFGIEGPHFRTNTVAAKFIKKTEYRYLAGHAIRVSKELPAFGRRIYKHEGVMVYPSKKGADTIFNANVSYRDVQRNAKTSKDLLKSADVQGLKADALGIRTKERSERVNEVWHEIEDLYMEHDEADE